MDRVSYITYYFIASWRVSFQEGLANDDANAKINIYVLFRSGKQDSEHPP